MGDQKIKDSGMAFFLSIVLRILSVLTTITILFFAVILCLDAIGSNYNAHHIIKNPVERGEDFGVGLIAMSAAAVGIGFSVLLFFPLNRLVSYLLNKPIRNDK